MIKLVDTSSLLPESVLEICMHEAGLDTLHEPHNLVLHNVLHSSTAFCLFKTFLNYGLSFSHHLITKQG